MKINIDTVSGLGKSLRIRSGAAPTSCHTGLPHGAVCRIGQGIGSALIDLAKQHSKGRMQLHTFGKNHNARRFYKKHGFTEMECGFEPNWKLDDVKPVWQRSVVAAYEGRAASIAISA